MKRRTTVLRLTGRTTTFIVNTTTFSDRAEGRRRRGGGGRSLSSALIWSKINLFNRASGEVFTGKERGIKGGQGENFLILRFLVCGKKGEGTAKGLRSKKEKAKHSSIFEEFPPNNLCSTARKGVRTWGVYPDTKDSNLAPGSLGPATAKIGERGGERAVRPWG